jgi:hypothetical protein
VHLVWGMAGEEPPFGWKRSGMEGERAVPVPDAGSASTWTPRGRRRLVVVLVVCAALLGGGVVYQLARDAAKNAARNLYGTQVNTTVGRILNEEDSQLRLKVVRRSAAAFGELTGRINRDRVLNPTGRLTVSLGNGSVSQPIQIAYSVTIASPYGATTAVVWTIYTGNTYDAGACVLTSTLLGHGRAKGDLNTARNMFLPPCANSFWSPGPVTVTHPSFTVAGIPR